MYQLKVIKRAREDMRKSANWYNKQQDGVGDRFLIQVFEVFNLIQSGPLLYEEKFTKKFRFAPVQGFPFLVAFKIKSQLVVVNTVFHTSRNPKRFV